MKTNDLHILLPASKSISNRWLLLNHVAGSPFILRKLSEADDTQLLQTLLSQLRSGHSNHYYCHNAGTVARFMMALLAFTPGLHTLSGDDRLLQRPMAPLINCLRGLGCNIVCSGQEGFLPVCITGCTPTHKMAEIDPVSSSQFVSAMMLVAPLLPNGITLTLTGRASSRPYIELTRDILRQAGFVSTVSANQRVYRVEPMAAAKIQQRKVIEIERDWSAASYIYAAAALLPGLRIRMQGLSLASKQGDKAVAEIFQHFGVKTLEVKSPYHTHTHSITIQGTGMHDDTFEYNFLDYPDLVPAVVTTCAALGIHARLKGAKNLRFKESDRLSALQAELKKMGGRITFSNRVAVITPSLLHASQPVNSHNDHRIAMAFGILSLRYPDLTIDDPTVVSKSFPQFWEQLKLIRKAAAPLHPNLTSAR